ncbi:hypothetical protein GCM10010435_35790 [Winogradskya consettensis]|uniref:Pyridoxamine 5'-phosphate oxidase N-terminal domain-containing protein n=1 Tax=Winogradskya consettensis TaxID=113560 RepID=A0A919SCF2_9ACTN|nr:pyridoxamine 5'-phosphate oxidase family protein [Actinoplanes consettensis]GIM68447.1 hypothetical protein Aco04nite_10740 [Actinoplanes consettensis]
MTDVLNKPPMPSTPPRPTVQRREDVLRKLTHERHLWLATSGPEGPHLIPLSYFWDGKSLLMTTKPNSRTVRNLRTEPHARAAIGTGADVVLIDGVVHIEPAENLNPLIFRRLPLSPERVPGVVALRLPADSVQAWRGVHEIPGRVVREDGHWLD